MKIIILSFFLTSQAQFVDDQSTTFVSNVFTSTINSFYLITNPIESSVNQFDDNVTTTISTDQSERWSSLSSLNDLESITVRNEILFKREEWFNVNQSNRKNTSSIFWRKINDHFTYILRSEGECLHKMCYVKLKYNGSLSNKKVGCLSFILWTRGQPVGQLWIEEDEEQQSFSQKIQLTNSSLRVEHSLKSKIENLSIDARILFTNSKIDTITLSNLNINWNGPCPKHHSEVTPIQDQSTSEDYLTTLTSEDFSEMSTLTTNERDQSSQEEFLIESSTIKLDKKESLKGSSSFVNQSNIVWILSLIILFCLLIIFSSFVYGIWTIQGHYRFIWYIPFDNPIQFLARRSIRSSTRSENRILTLEQISNEILQMDIQQNSFETFSTTSSTQRSTPSAFDTYF